MKAAYLSRKHYIKYNNRNTQLYVCVFIPCQDLQVRNSALCVRQLKHWCGKSNKACFLLQAAQVCCGNCQKAGMNSLPALKTWTSTDLLLSDTDSPPPPPRWKLMVSFSPNAGDFLTIVSCFLFFVFFNVLQFLQFRRQKQFLYNLIWSRSVFYNSALGLDCITFLCDSYFRLEIWLWMCFSFASICYGSSISHLSS